LAWITLLGVPCVACDQAAKVLASRALQSGPVEYLDGIVQFRLVHNTGAFLSLGEHFPEWLRTLIFLGLVPLALAVALIVLMRSMEPTRATLVGASLILSGGIGNWIDRMLHGGGVVDFVSIGLGGLRTGIFNVADVAIVVGVIIVMWELRTGPADPEPATTPDPPSPPQSPSR
jgi:signal peptidase II